MSTSVVATNDADSLRYDHQQHPTNSLTPRSIFKDKSRNETPLNSHSLGCLPRGSGTHGTTSPLLPHETLFLRLEAQERQVQEVLDRQKAMGAWLDQLCEAANVPAGHQIEPQAELLVGISADLLDGIPSTINSPDLVSHEEPPPSSCKDDYHPISNLHHPTEASDLITPPENIRSPRTTAHNAIPAVIEPDDDESDLETDPTLVRYAICYKLVPPGTTSLTGAVADIVRQEVDLDAAFMPRVSRTKVGRRPSAFAGSRPRATRVEKGEPHQRKKLKKCVADGAV